MNLKTIKLEEQNYDLLEIINQLQVPDGWEIFALELQSLILPKDPTKPDTDIEFEDKLHVSRYWIKHNANVIGVGFVPIRGFVDYVKGRQHKKWEYSILIYPYENDEPIMLEEGYVASKAVGITIVESLLKHYNNLNEREHWPMIDWKKQGWIPYPGQPE